jgi:1,4-alpha-glucan branching enzyme
MTPYIRTVHGNTDDPGSRLDDGASLLHWMNGEIQKRHPGKLLIAEDMKGEAFVTTPVSAGGLGFHAQWDSLFVHPVRGALIATDDAHRDLHKVTGALSHRYGPDAFTRVVFTESHDEASNGQARVAEDIAPGNVESWYALKRSTLGGALVMTAPGIPMLFQGQALYEDGWFSDSDPLDWSRVHTFRGINQLYMDLIALRLNRKGLTPGLTGHELEVLSADHQARLLAYARWQEEKADSTVVVMNFSAAVIHDYHVPFPVEGAWYVHFNSDWDGYHEEFSNHFSYDPLASTRHDGIVTAPITIAPYTALILSRARPD